MEILKKVFYNKIQMPKVVDRFKYSVNNIVPSQWIRKKNHSNEITRLSIPQRLKNLRKSFRNTAASTIPSKNIYLDSEQPRAYSSFNLMPISTPFESF
ncbi:hypothetical protein TNCT_16131 [Trichonephila clavata]|uniref:Uncharacterized protein n=1 Tax=Trichonephila clavata TaxID=2740835 RepID=A0A8X6LYK0_TRICU|nr:hypothetical protein TNCT_16131 [Trichonephila clavata]